MTWDLRAYHSAEVLNTWPGIGAEESAGLKSEGVL
jgi:hypothetical protein